jgi:ribosomal protein S6--L-glutamate ligase
MKIAIIGLNPYFESDRVLYEALKKGHEVVYLSKRHIVESNFFNGGKFGIFFKVPTIKEQYKSEKMFTDVRPIILKPPKELNPTYETKGMLGKKVVSATELFDINYFDVVLVREITKTLEWATILVNYLLSHNKVVVDQKIGEEMYYKSKHGTFYKASMAGFPYARTFAVISKKMLSTILQYVSYPLIVKKSVSSKGKGVYKCTSKHEVYQLIEEESLKVGDLLFQEMVDYQGDIRVFVLGNKVLGAMRREPQAGQWKGNVAQGAIAYPIDIDNSIRQMALDVVAMQHAELIGVDIMMPKTGPIIIETNRAPQFQGFEAATGVNVAKEIVTYLEEKYAKISNTQN